MGRRLTAITVSLGAIGLTGCGGAAPESACDRDCLIGIGEDYLSALAANDPALVPFAENSRFVENINRLAPGEGAWTTIDAVSAGFRIFVADVEQQSVGSIALIEQRTNAGIVPELLAVRLQLAGGEITEAEHLIGELQPTADAASLTAPRDGLITEVPENEREDRARLVAIAERYYEGLDTSNAGIVPFADDCERQENGLITAGWNLAPATFDSVDVNGNSPPPVARDCIGQMNSARFAYIDSIDNRRVFAADPVLGLAMGFSHFRQSMNRGPLEMIAADGSSVMWEEQREPYDLPAAHIFKITAGEIHEIEAIGIFVPYDSPTGWE